MVSDRRAEIYHAIRQLEQKNDYSPTVRQIAEAVGLGVSATHRHLRILVDKGLVLAPQRPGAGWRVTPAR